MVSEAFTTSTSTAVATKTALVNNQPFAIVTGRNPLKPNRVFKKKDQP